MASPKTINERIAAALGQLHVEKIVQADALADSLDEVTISAIDKAVRIASSIRTDVVSKILSIGGVLKNLPNQYQKHLAPRLAKLNLWASQKAALIFTTEVPRTWMASKIKTEQAKSGKKETPPSKIHEMPKDEYESLVQRYVLKPRKKADIEKTMNRPVEIVKPDGQREVLTWEERIQNLSKLVDPEAVAKKVVIAQESGESAQKLAEMLVSETKGVGASAKRIARTETLRQLEDEQVQRYDELGDIYIGRQYIATLDERVRAEHAILHGRIWWKDRQPYLTEFPSPPIAANCRCYSASVLAPPEDALNDPVYLAELRSLTAGGPDVNSMSAWWNETDIERRRLSVGTKRYNTLADHLGRQPDWVDFINVDGGLMKLPALLKETEEQRQRRRMAINMTVGDQARLAADVKQLGFTIQG